MHKRSIDGSAIKWKWSIWSTSSILGDLDEMNNNQQQRTAAVGGGTGTATRVGVVVPQSEKNMVFKHPKSKIYTFNVAHFQADV